MAKSHGARQQKKLAKQKAKRTEKRNELTRRSSMDPIIRLRGADRWPVVETLVSKGLWKDGIGYLVIARQEGAGRLIYASYLVDVFCLGVKDTFWDAGAQGSFRELIERMGKTQAMQPIAPECLAKIVKGAVDFAASFGFPPHPDFRHTAMLLGGIDPVGCPNEYTFGRDGKPFYFQGPNESSQQALAIAERVRQAGGHFTVVAGRGLEDDDLDDEFDEDYDDEFDELEDDDDLALPPY